MSGYLNEWLEILPDPSWPISYEVEEMVWHVTRRDIPFDPFDVRPLPRCPHPHHRNVWNQIWRQV